MLGPQSVVFARLVSVGIIVVFAVGAAIAAIPTANGSVSFCVQKVRRVSGTGPLGPTVILDRIGTLRAIDFENGQVCEDDELRLGFNLYPRQGDPGPQGPQGPQGPAGPQGPPGPAGGVSVARSGTRFAASEEAAALPDSNTGKVIGSMVVPAGHYALTAGVTLHPDFTDSASDDFAAVCWIDAGGEVVDQDSVQAQRVSPSRHSVTMHGVIALDTLLSAIRVRCRDYQGSATAWQRVTITAVQVTEAREVNLGAS